MNDGVSNRLASVKFGLMLSLLTLVYAFGLGAVFGVWEKDIKSYIKSEAEAVKADVYKIDAEAEAVKDDIYKDKKAKMDEVIDKSWVYFKRAHLHAAGLGAISLGVCLLLAFLDVCRWCKLASSVTLGLGALLYSMFWMFAGMRAPGLGSTSAAKESLALLAKPAVILCLAGLLIAAFHFCTKCVCNCCCMCKRGKGDEDQT